MVRSLIGLCVFRRKPVSSSVVRPLFGLFVLEARISTLLTQCWNFGSRLIDGDFEKEQKKTLLLGTPDPFRNLVMEKARIEHAPMEVKAAGFVMYCMQLRGSL